MAINPHNRKPLKILSALAAVTLGLYGLLFAVTTWGRRSVAAQARPRPRGRHPDHPRSRSSIGNAKVTNDQLDPGPRHHRAARRRQRCRRRRGDHPGGQNIVVSMPGTPDKATEDAIRKSSQLRFRPVLAAAAGAEPAGTDRRTPTGTATGTGDGHRHRHPPAATVPHRHRHRDDGQVRPARRLRQGRPPTPAADRRRPPPAPRRRRHRPPSRSTAATSPGSPTRSPPSSRSSTAPSPGVLDGIVDDPDQPLVTCSDDGAEKYILGPVEVGGDQIKDAVVRLPSRCPNGQPSIQVEIRAVLQRQRRPRRSATSPSASSTCPSPRNQFAVDARLAGHHGARSAGRHPRRPGQHHRQLHHRLGARPGQPAEVRCAAAVVHAADAGPDQPDPRQRAAQDRPARRPHRHAAGRPLLARCSTARSAW